MRLRPGDVEVRENGRLVSDLAFVPAGRAGGAFGVVLVVDTSESMRGPAIEGAVAAARAFAGRKNRNQLLALVTFDSVPRVALRFTRDGNAIERALAAPRLSKGTRVYDAISEALTLIGDARISAASIVVLSDGADTGSLSSGSAIAAQARRARVRIFSVGLRSRFFDPQPLQTLADRTDGRYSEATSGAQLTRIYAELGDQFASEYLLRYTSGATPGEKVQVRVRVAGIAGSAAASYRASSARATGDRLWRSPLAMILVSIACALLLGFAIGAFAIARTRNVRDRVSAFVGPPAHARRVDGGGVRAMVLGPTEDVLARARWWPRIAETLEIAQVNVPAGFVALGTLGATLAAMWLLTVGTGSSLGAPLGLAVPVVVAALVKRKLAAVRSRFADQLPDNLQVLASALRAGHSFVGALAVVADDGPEPSRREFRRVVADEQLGIPVEGALRNVVERMRSTELEYVALVSGLHRETGGNTAEVLDRVTETIRERFELRRMVRTLTAQGRMARWVVTLLPIGLLGAIMLLSPGYMDPLFNRSVGVVLLALAAVLVVAGSLVIKRIVEIEV
jgi:tight adherence protein B